MSRVLQAQCRGGSAGENHLESRCGRRGPPRPELDPSGVVSVEVHADSVPTESQSLAFASYSAASGVPAIGKPAIES